MSQLYPKTTEREAINAQAEIHHALLLGMQLTVSMECGGEVMEQWMFKLFRRQHEDKFLSSFKKLGLDGLPDAVACVHVRCALPSPQREETLGRLGPLVRRARFVMAALVDRRDRYSVSLPQDKRRRDPVEAVSKLVELLSDPERLQDGIVPDRRGRS